MENAYSLVHQDNAADVPSVSAKGLLVQFPRLVDARVVAGP